MPRIYLVCWHDDDAATRLELLRDGGHSAERAALDMSGFREIRDSQPDAVVIDLDRRPSHGREAAKVLRTAKKTRQIPLVFAGGQREKVNPIRELLPDAVYTSWEAVAGAVDTALARPPTRPIVPPGPMDGYADTPLINKLGIQAGATLVLLHPPQDLIKLLGPLPDDVTVRDSDRGRRDLTIWFVRSQRELTDRIDRMADKLDAGTALWIAWPKKTSAIASDVTQNIVRGIGIAAGLVDYKICAIDATWSALKFTRRKRADH
jgi:CheY-like chemotaxis protein